MSIARAITDLQDRVEDAYDALEAKGATIPATKNTANLPATIESVPTGSPAVYGIDSAHQLLGTASITGAATFNNVTEFAVSFDGIKSLTNEYFYAYRFQRNGRITSLSFPDLTLVAGNYSLQQICYSCSHLTSVLFPSLKKISGGSSFSASFQGCTLLASVSLPNLEEISGSGALGNAFRQCVSLTTISFPKLATIVPTGFAQSTFNSCSNLAEIHFKSSAQSQVEATSGYSSKWGASNATIYFDL